MMRRDAALPPPAVVAFGDVREFEVLRRAWSLMPPRLSVIVPNYNTGALVRDTVASILAQTMADLEVIVVDDGSTDDGLAGILALHDARLTCLRQRNRGLAGARNTGILAARAPLIGFCDSDDVWSRHKAAFHLHLLEQEPEIDVTFSCSAYIDESGAPTGGFLITRCTRPELKDLLQRNHLGNGSTVILRRSCLRRAGLFDESLRSCEDWELWVRIAAVGHGRFALLREPLTGYRVRVDSLSHAGASFVREGRLMVERFLDYVPDFGEREARRTFAEVLRIASRKSLSAGDVVTSRRLFLQAWRQSPRLVADSPRNLALAGLHALGTVLPRRAVLHLFHVMEGAVSRAQRLYLGPDASELSPRPGTAGPATIAADVSGTPSAPDAPALPMMRVAPPPQT